MFKTASARRQQPVQQSQGLPSLEVAIGASVKGGVGKTNVSVNIASYYAKMLQDLTCRLIEWDFKVNNHDFYLGNTIVKPSSATLGKLIKLDLENDRDLINAEFNHYFSQTDFGLNFLSVQDEQLHTNDNKKIDILQNKIKALNGNGVDEFEIAEMLKIVESMRGKLQSNQYISPDEFFKIREAFKFYKRNNPNNIIVHDLPNRDDWFLLDLFLDCDEKVLVTFPDEICIRGALNFVSKVFFRQILRDAKKYSEEKSFNTLNEYTKGALQDLGSEDYASTTIDNALQSPSVSSLTKFKKEILRRDSVGQLFVLYKFFKEHINSTKWDHNLVRTFEDHKAKYTLIQNGELNPQLKHILIEIEEAHGNSAESPDSEIARQLKWRYNEGLYGKVHNSINKVTPIKFVLTNLQNYEEERDARDGIIAFSKSLYSSEGLPSNNQFYYAGGVRTEVELLREAIEQKKPFVVNDNLNRHNFKLKEDYTRIAKNILELKYSTDQLIDLKPKYKFKKKGFLSRLFS
ncbi:hypothetical protein ACFL1H_01935 [Nanoarchaeota archaeon]